VKLLGQHRQGRQGHDIGVLAGEPLLVNAAVDAVKKWEYLPAVLDGQAVAVKTQNFGELHLGAEAAVGR